MDKEYEVLHHEIVEWQARRFTVVGGSLVVTTALLGWVVTCPERWSWDLASALPLAFLACSCYLTWLFARFNAMIGAYLEVFHASPWEGRSRQFRSRFRFMTLNSALAAMYLVLGGMCVTVAYSVSMRKPSPIGILVFAVSLFAFLLSLAALGFRSYPRSRYMQEWRAISDRESEV